jgi:ATP-dependent protease ClpP protease subunit
MKQGIFLRQMEAGSKDQIIDVIGVIGWEVWFTAMRDMLKAIPDTVERVVFDIYSPGGDVWEGNAIIHEIGKLKQKTVARVQVAASMATLIALACEEREIADNGRWLIHNPWTAVMGDAASLEKRAKELRDCEMEAAAFYAKRTGKTPDEMLKLMAEERWLTAKETKEMGFVQKINDPFDSKAFAQVQAEIVAAGKWPKALIAIPEEKNDDNATTAGAEGVGQVAPVPPVQPADAPSQYDAGKAAGRLEAQADWAIERTTLIAAHKEEIAKRDKLVSEYQSAKDRAIAEGKAALAKAASDAQAREAELQKTIEKLTVTVKDSGERLNKLLSGGMTFHPAPIATWEEAMQAANGDYAKAAKLDPERKLRDEYNAKHKRK